MEPKDRVQQEQATLGKEMCEMKKLAISAMLIALVLLAAQTASATVYNVGLMGSGSLMNGGATYSGTFLFGLSGTWTIDVNDSLWPVASDSTARWDYLWNFFEYDDTQGGEAWFATFDLNTLGSIPTFEFVTTDGVLAGDCTFRIMIRDWNGDGVLSQTEKHHDLQIVYTLSVNPDLGTGDFTGWCGDGSMSAFDFRFVNPPDADAIQIMGRVETKECPSPVEQTTWGTIKALYY
jgi:hypothetical protein